MEAMHLTLGHSPDPDDAFMFWALATDQFDTGEYSFEHILQDIQTLNERAMRSELHITAISIHSYAHLMDKYALLPTGSSMGDGYGPMLVAKKGAGLTVGELASKKILIPGKMTTAYLAARLLLGEFDCDVAMFDEIPAKVASGEYEAGLIIHEGQLTYDAEGLELVRDLGVWWQEDTGLPLPLGGNAIRRDLGPERMSEINRILKRSIELGLENREAAVAHAMQYARHLDTATADKFIGMYVNEWTLDYGDRGREAIRLLLNRGHEAGIIPAVQQLEFVA
jgi:1,4-dihydroxy-6-naphthoate synthase